MPNGPEEERDFMPTEGIPEAERFHRRWERSPLWEMVAEGEPHQITPAVRARMSWMEQMTVLDKRPPNTYPALLMTQEIAEREHAVRCLYPLGLAEWPEKLKKPKKLRETDRGYHEDKEARERLVNTLKDAHEEMQARLALMNKVHEQLMFSTDVEVYLRDYFLRWGKTFLPSADYGIILNAKETHKGLVPFGEKVEAAFNAFLEIGRGEAEVTLENGKTKRLPNILGLPSNRGLLMFALEKYVLPKLEGLRKIEGQKELETLDNVDNFAAALVAFELFRHWDYDVYFCFGRKGGGESWARRRVMPGEWNEMALEIGAGSGDSAKAMWFEARRAAEHGRIEKGGVGRREHPREAGNPMSFGCYPMLTTHMLDIVTIQMPLSPEMVKQVREHMKVDGDQETKYDENEGLFVLEQRDRKGKLVARVKFGRKIQISVHDRCYGKSVKIPVKVEMVDSRDPSLIKEKKEEAVTLSYSGIPLRDIKWDDVELINADTDEEWLDFALGTPTDAYEIPYKLQGYYSFMGLYDQVMRTDFMKQHTEVVEGNLLRKMNKQIQIALGLLASGFQLRESTVDKLSNYIRCVFLGTLMAGVKWEKESGRSLEAGPQVSEYGGSKRGDEAYTSLMAAARPCAFLNVVKKEEEDREKGKIEGEFDPAQVQLVKRIMDKRGPILPSQTGWFNKEELEELAPLYPLGL
jgi:hypothetical protein